MGLQGMLSIPFAEIEEPFNAWANMPDMKSRIDYYGGMVKTFQRGDIKEFGTTAKIIPMTNEVVVNEIDCFAVDGGKEYKIEPQSILPDITDFELVGDDLKNGQECQKWQKNCSDGPEGEQVHHVVEGGALHLRQGRPGCTSAL